jgi:hypothetical protein
MNSSDKPYRLPDPKKEPAAFLVLLYKTLKRVPYDDRTWDKIFFPRCMKRMGELLEVMQGNAEAAGLCVKELAEKFNDAGLDYTLETVIAHSYEWRAEREKRTDRECLKALLGAYVNENGNAELTRADPERIIRALTQAAKTPAQIPEKIYNSHVAQS